MNKEYKMRGVKNLLYIFIKPKEVFKELKTSPHFLYPVITILLIDTISGYNTGKILGISPIFVIAGCLYHPYLTS